MRDSISVIICAYNEGKSIAEAVRLAEKAVRAETEDYELIVVDDASTDGTGEAAVNAAGGNKRIRVVSHRSNLGFGAAYRRGIKEATKEYIAGFTSDLDLLPEDFAAIIKNRKKADLVMSYLTNMKERPVWRRAYSEGFVFLMNRLFGMNLKYFNGYFICRRELLKTPDLKSEGFTLFAEVKIKLIKKGASYYEVPILFSTRKYGKSKALSAKSIFQAIKIMPVLLKDVYF